MATYGAIRTKFIARLRRGDVTTSLADGFLQDAIQRTQRVLRIPGMEKSVSVTLSDATYFDEGRLPIPSDYIKLKDIWVTSTAGKTNRLERKDLDYVIRTADEFIGITPDCFARQGSSWVFAPYPLDATVVRIDYLSEFETSDADADDTILTSIAPDAILYGALSIGCDHFNDKRGPLFEQRYTQIISDIQMQGDEDELTGSAQMQSSFVWPEDGEEAS